MATIEATIAKLQEMQAKDPHEEVFCLRAQDILFTKTVNGWADAAHSVGAPIPKIQEARACARRGGFHLPKKIPD